MAEQMLTESANAGDLIEVFRAVHNHWAVYIGDCEVVHLAHGKDGMGSFSSSSSSSNKAVVKRHKIWEVTNGDRWRINNLLDDKYEPHKRHIIMKEAISRVGEELPYSITTKNCEHFVTELRYGKHKTWQFRNVALIAAGAPLAVAAAAGAVNAGAPLAVAAAAGATVASLFSILRPLSR